MEQPIQKTLASFTNLCINKNECPCFSRRGLVSFFYDNREEYSDILGDINFVDNGEYISSHEINNEMDDLLLRRWMFAWGPYFHPYELREDILKKYKELSEEDKKGLEEITQKFYDKVGCDRSGRLNRHTKFNSINPLY